MRSSGHQSTPSPPHLIAAGCRGLHLAPPPGPERHPAHLLWCVGAPVQRRQLGPFWQPAHGAHCVIEVINATSFCFVLGSVDCCTPTWHIVAWLQAISCTCPGCQWLGLWCPPMFVVASVPAWVNRQVCWAHHRCVFTTPAGLHPSRPVPAQQCRLHRPQWQRPVGRGAHLPGGPLPGCHPGPEWQLCAVRRPASLPHGRAASGGWGLEREGHVEMLPPTSSSLWVRQQVHRCIGCPHVVLLVAS